MLLKKISFLALSTLLISGTAMAYTPSESELTDLCTTELFNQHDQEEIVLNKGEKWVVIEEMMVYFQNMEIEVQTFEKEETKDYKSFAANLTSNINALTSNCTMTGQGHDELHKWLLPYIDLVNEYSDDMSSDESSEFFKNVKSSFETFHIYFK